MDEKYNKFFETCFALFIIIVALFSLLCIFIILNIPVSESKVEEMKGVVQKAYTQLIKDKKCPDEIDGYEVHYDIVSKEITTSFANLREVKKVKGRIENNNISIETLIKTRTDRFGFGFALWFLFVATIPSVTFFFLEKTDLLFVIWIRYFY